ncbi:hypothetical protein ACFOHU_02685 [Ottowia pentelensis]|uniref:DUF2244 domain-containing protein n=1 Tax=Ottowia pentelensis TaxID=511108 RepID=A0ABV6PRD0_9BURK
MHAAPAVTHPTGRTPQLAALLLRLWAVGWVAVAVALMLQPDLAAPGWPAAALLGAPLLAGAALAHWWWAQRPRRLSWDGAQWRLGADAPNDREDAALQRLEPRLDLQWALLLRASGPEAGRSRWLWAQAGRDAAGWHLLRCAVHAGAPAPAADLGEGARA